MTTQSIELSKPGQAKQAKELIVSPNQLWAVSLGLAEIIREGSRRRQERFHTIVGIGRGGWIPAQAIASKLGGDAIHLRNESLRSYSEAGRTQTGQVEQGQALTPADVEGKNLLVADDLNDSDRTRKRVMRLYSEMGAGLIRFAAPYFKDLEFHEVEPDYDITIDDVMSDPRIDRPDYYSARTRRDQWLMLPHDQAAQNNSGYQVFYPSAGQVIDLAVGE